MSQPPVFVAILLVSLSIFVSSCSDTELPPLPKSTNRSEQNTKVKIKSIDDHPTTPGRGGWSLFRKRDRHYHKQYVNPAIDQFWKANYPTLEKQAQTYRDEKTLRNDGGWALVKFYYAFDNYHDVNQVNPERYHAKMERMLKEWMAAFPESPTPQVALAGFYTGHAWFARGSGYSGSVTEEAWQQFRDRLKSAEQTLNASAVGKQDPYYYRVAIRVGLGMGWPMEKIEGYFQEGRKLAPEYWGLYHACAYHQLPRWHGDEHTEWEQWLTSALADSGLSSDLQDEFYAQVAMGIMSVAYDHPKEPNMIKVAGVDWERFQRGAETLMKKYPTSTKIPSRYLRIAMQAGDFDVARSIVKRMNFIFDGMEWWGNNAYEFYEIVDFLKEDAASKQKTEHCE